jgi:hypothetical protein
MKRRFGPGTIVLPAPWEVGELMRQVRKGRVTTINEIRAQLARRHGATIACPIVTGIHARIAAGAAGEAEADGARRVTPYWRTLKEGGSSTRSTLAVLRCNVGGSKPKGSARTGRVVGTGLADPPVRMRRHVTVNDLMQPSATPCLVESQHVK